jgi:hypothetical protein
MEVEAATAKAVDADAPRKRSDIKYPDLIAWENWAANLSPDTLMYKAPCDFCKRMMWTRDVKLENVCEDCGYAQMTEATEALARRQTPRSSNVFADHMERHRLRIPGNPLKLF